MEMIVPIICFICLIYIFYQYNTKKFDTALDKKIRYIDLLIVLNLTFMSLSQVALGYSVLALLFVAELVLTATVFIYTYLLSGAMKAKNKRNYYLNIMIIIMFIVELFYQETYVIM